MTAEQVVRAAIIRQIGCYAYRELAFHLSDSRVCRQFCKIGMGRGTKHVLSPMAVLISYGTADLATALLLRGLDVESAKRYADMLH